MIGSVTVPVSLHKAAGHLDDIVLRQIHARCGTPIAQDRACPACEVKIPAGADDQLTRAVEVGEGVFVELGRDELEEALGGREVVLTRFAPEVLLRPEQLDTTYWVAPARDALSRRAYDGLARALRQGHLVGLGRLALSTRERVAAVRAIDVDGAGWIIALTTLFPAAGIRAGDAAEIRQAVESLGAARATEEEVDLFVQALEQRHVPSAFRWTATQRWFPSRLRELVQAKELGGTVQFAPAADPVAPRDLAAALKKTVRASRKRTKVPA